MDVVETKVSPGSFIAESDKYVSSTGTYEKDGKIYSSLLGTVKIEEGNPKPKIIVEPPNKKPNKTPQLRDVVLAQVTAITPNHCKVNILCIGDEPLSDTFPGTIQLSDVRQTHMEQVEMYKCFRPGDIIRAEVISLGDSRSYYLSTARNEYGVIMAKSVSGEPMIPVSWNLMQCTKTKLKEYRKVAKTTDI